MACLGFGVRPTNVFRRSLITEKPPASCTCNNEGRGLVGYYTYKMKAEKMQNAKKGTNLGNG
jgi:hypothetical protein